MSDQEFFNQEHSDPENESKDSGAQSSQDSRQDGMYSYSYKDINQGDTTENGSGAYGQQSSFHESRGGNQQQAGENYYQWNPYQEPKKKGFFARRKEKKAQGQQVGSGSSPKSGGKFSVKLAKVAAIALVFGLVAGVVFQGSSYLTGKLLGTDTPTKVASSILTKENLDYTSTSSAITINDVSDIVKNVMPAVVAVTNMTTVQYQSFFGGTGTREVQSAGSGIIISQNDSYLFIATNNHVVSGAETLTITFVDGSSASGEIKGTDPSSDLAVVAVSLKDLESSTMEQIKVATIGDSDSLQVGQAALVIGNGLGYGQSVSAGIVSALDRKVQLQDSSGNVITNNLIQTDAAVNPGNSGGALLDMNGQVIGIVSAKYMDEQVEGMGYAIPISSAASIIDQLINQEEVDESESSYLGISGADVSNAFSQQYDLPTGVYVTRVAEGSPAEKAGLAKGDVIVSFNGRNVNSMEEIQNQMKYIKAGTKVEIKVAKASENYEEKTMEVTLGKKK